MSHELQQLSQRESHHQNQTQNFKDYQQRGQKRKNLYKAIAGIIALTVIIQLLLYFIIPPKYVFVEKVSPTPPTPPAPHTIQQDKQCLSPYKKSFSVAAGEMHYSRVPQQYWEHRIKMIKALGPTAISFYVMWNFHEVEKGVFDFESYGKNLTYFLELAKKHHMKVWIRPGPYVCGEWDFGGLPARLLVMHQKLRTASHNFMAETRIYFSALAQIIKPYIGCHNSIIQLLQIQNQNGYFRDQPRSYIEGINAIWNDLGIKTNRYFVQIAADVHKSYWEGAVIGLNDYFDKKTTDQLQKQYPNATIIGGQLYTGWIVYWWEGFQSPPGQKLAKQVRELLLSNHSIDIYLAHGGTNFGLTAGALNDFRSIITSYDWGAPINERGAPTYEYYIIRREFERCYARLATPNQRYYLPQIPDQIPMISIPPFTLQLQATIIDSLPQPHLTNLQKIPQYQSNQLQMFHQGILIYETWIPKGQYKMQVMPKDYAWMLINGKYVLSLDRKTEGVSAHFSCYQQHNKLTIINQAVGHVNFGWEMSFDHKGFDAFNITTKTTSESDYSEKVELKWNITKLLLNDTNQLFSFNKIGNGSPVLLKAQISLDQTGDTFLDMKNLGKGYVWINGHSLGRYWNVGGQQRLYCPGVWLRKGSNDIKVLQMHQIPQRAQIQGKTMSDREQARKIN